MKILTHPNPLLRRKAKKVELEELNDKEIQKFIDDLTQKMVEAEGIGFAAPQVGKSLRIIVVNTEECPTPFINPVILWKSIHREIDEEGCLSVPKVYGLVKRAKSLRLVYRDRTGKKKHLKASGLFARVLQHEIDHLNGILFIDRMIKQIIAAEDKK